MLAPRNFFLLTFCLLSFRLAAAEQPGEDWPRFLGPHADGTSAETGLLDKWPKSGPPMLWEKTLGTGYSAPSILGNQLVVHHRLGNEEIVECLDANTGASLWHYNYPSQFIDPYGYNNGPRACPLLTANLCYTFGAEGKLICLELKTGKLVWQRDTGSEWNVPPAFFGVG
ncbi:MAG TPA: PQQ-binding-like beta-propeller repeat protein, partial [Verrucomicrobiae bacterium]|nr:PQQ-binding-like beta-propeller repeat protein [Verrucomicrobiae bacterium]